MTPHDLVVTRSGLRFRGRRFAASIGRNGVTTAKREGDGATPQGSHGLIGLLFRPDRIAAAQLPGWAVPIRPGDLWSDDPRDPDYNLMVRTPHSFGHEALRRPDPVYDIILLTDWNWPRADRGQGSAIFVHVWRRRGFPTAGCIAISRADLLWIARRIRHRTRLIVRS